MTASNFPACLAIIRKEEGGKFRQECVTPDRLRQLLTYDSATGLFRWAKCRFGSAFRRAS